jgi:hypothetical protein
MSGTSQHSGAVTAELVRATAPWRPDAATASAKDLGSHLTGTLLLVLGGLAARHGGTRGVASLCIGGEATAVAIERLH